MLIGNDERYLRIERDDPADWYAPLRIEARLRAPGQAQFFGWSDVATIIAGPSERVAYEKFVERRSAGITFSLAGHGSLELEQRRDGSIIVLFTVTCPKVGPHWKLSGDVLVDAATAHEFLGDFRRVVFGDDARQSP